MTEENKEITYLEFGEFKIDPVIFTQGFVLDVILISAQDNAATRGVYMDRDFQPIKFGKSD